MENLAIGLRAEATTKVTRENMAVTMGSGDLEVFATPAMVALMEQAAVRAVRDVLPEGSTTVGSEMHTTHVRPTGAGAEVTATAELEAVEGRKLTFRVEAHDAVGEIGSGTHVRYVVDRVRFLSKVGG